MAELVFDSDSFFWPSSIGDEYMHNPRKGICFDKENQPLDVLFEQYYLGFRSSLFVSEEGCEKEDGLEVLRQWREASVLMAIDYVRHHLTSDVSLPADFMWITKMAIIEQVKYKYPNSKDILLNLSMKPRLSARVKNKNTIIFPALIRSLLNHCNMVVINLANESTDNTSKEIDRRYLTRFILPYLLFCHDDFSVRNLPMVGGSSKSMIIKAVKYTNIQVLFIIAHEYAHILLKHIDDYSQLKRESKEIEADSYALDIVLGHGDSLNQYTKYDAYVAIQLLFKYQLLEEMIGEIIKGNTLKISITEFEKRMGNLHNRFVKRVGIINAELLNSVEFAIINELQDVLINNSTNLIDTIIKAINKSKTKGEIEPWWEIIE